MMLLTTTQAIFGLFLDAWLLGVVFNRLARGTPRANTVLFSDRGALPNPPASAFIVRTPPDSADRPLERLDLKRALLCFCAAVVRKIRGRYHLMFQVCEMRKHALLEAHVRMYTVRKDMDHLGTGAVAYFQPFHMRVQHPDDELGGAWSPASFCTRPHSPVEQPVAPASCVSKSGLWWCRWCCWLCSTACR